MKKHRNIPEEAFFKGVIKAVGDVNIAFSVDRYAFRVRQTRWHHRDHSIVFR